MVAVARKLAIVLHRMWTDGTPFRWSDKDDAEPSAPRPLSARAAVVAC
jgi:hypothetical protein